MTMTQVMGCGIQRGSTERYRGAVVDSTLLPKVKAEVVVSEIPVDKVIEATKKVLDTGHIGKVNACNGSDSAVYSSGVFLNRFVFMYTKITENILY